MGKSAYCRARLKNGYVTISGYSGGDLDIPSKQFFELATLPEEYRPTREFYFSVPSLGGTAEIMGSVTRSGNVRLYSDTATNYWTYSFTYPSN